MKKMKVMSALALASLVGWPKRGLTIRMANEAAATTRSAQHWKGRMAHMIGKPEMATADDDSLDAAGDAHLDAMRNEMAEPKGKIVEQANAKETETKETKTEEETDEVKALRLENTTILLDNAVSDGRVPAGERASWVTRFAQDYEEAKKALANAKPTIKTRATATNRGADNAAIMEDETSRREKVHTLVNAKTEKGMSYENAFIAVQRENPQLFEAMKQPEKSKK